MGKDIKIDPDFDFSATLGKGRRLRGTIVEIKPTFLVFGTEIRPSDLDNRYWVVAMDLRDGMTGLRRPVPSDRIIEFLELLEFDYGRASWVVYDSSPTSICPLDIPHKVRGLGSGVVYFFADRELQFVKIGWTSAHPETRLEQVQSYCPLDLTVLATIEGTQKMERSIHRQFSHLRTNGEWFRADSELLKFIGQEGSSWNM